MADGFHDGELAVQRRAGVVAEAARLSGMLAPARLGGGLNRFLADRTFAVLTGRDRDGRLWISPLAGPPGFLAPASATTLTIRAAPAPGDPLHALRQQPVGLLVIDFAGRRRVRINGNLTGADSGTLHVEAAQAYGNCPRYIQRRDLEPAACLRTGDRRKGQRRAPGNRPHRRRHRADRRRRHVLHRHRARHRRRRRLAPRRVAGIRPRGRRPPVVARLRRQQHVQHPRQPRRRPRRRAAVRRLRHRPDPAPVRNRGPRLDHPEHPRGR